MKQIIVDLDIPPEEFLKHYQGSAKIVSATARDGRTVQFPTNILQSFVTQQGVQGAFSIAFDDNNKFASIERLY